MKKLVRQFAVFPLYFLVLAWSLPRPAQAAWPWDGQEVTVVSEVFHSASYTRSSRTLVLTFKRGGTYQYQDVPPVLYEDFLGAIEKGRFFNQKIRGQFKSQRLPASGPHTTAQIAASPPAASASCAVNESLVKNTPNQKEQK